MFIGEILKKNFKLVKENFWFFLKLVLLYIIIIFGPALILSKFVKSQFLSQIILIIIYSLIEIGVIIISLQIVKEKKFSLKKLFNGYLYLPSYLGAWILYFLICLGGIFLLIFPGVIWGIKFVFYPYLIVDKKLKAIEALKESAKLTEGFKWDIFGFAIVVSIINILGILLFLIGIFWTLPLVWLSWANLYVILTKK